MAFVNLCVALALLAADRPKPVDARLAIDLFAAEPDIVTPTGITVDARGRVLVIESHTHFRPEGYKGPPADRIRIFEDKDGDGKADAISTFFEGSKWTMGIGLAIDGSAYVATRSEVFRLQDKDSDGKAEVKTPIARLETKGDYPHNGLSGFAFDFEGNVYFGLGENLGVPYALVGSDGTRLTGGGEGGNIYRCRPDGSGLVRLATGFWNPFHLGFDTFGRLFAVDNDPDSRPPCRLLHIVQGGDYGYRFRNGRKGLHPFTAWNGELPGTLPMLAGTGEAPSGVISYESDNLPSDYRGSVLTTSWGDHRIERFRPQPRGASLTATPETIITGGDNFRPVGLAVAPDGSLFASDWVDQSYPIHGKGRIWHIHAAKPSQRDVPNDDVEALAHADHALRRAAASRLATSNDGKGKDALRTALKSHADPRARAVAYEALHVADPADTSLAIALSDPTPEIRASATRTIADALLNAQTIASVDASSAVRAEALRRIPPQERGNTPGERLLLKALEEGDPYVTRAAVEGIKRAIRLSRAVELASDPNPAHRLGILLVLRESADPEARKPIPTFLGDPDPTIRMAAIQWVAEQDLKEFRPLVADGLAKGAVTRSLFEAYLAALDRLDGSLRSVIDERGGQDFVAGLVKDPKTPVAVRRRALRILRPDHPALTLERLRDLARDSDPGVRLEAIRSLRESPQPGRIAILTDLARDESLPELLRAEAVVGLSGADPAQRPVLVGLATQGTPVLRREALRSLRDVSLTDEQKAALTTAVRGDEPSAALIATLTSPDRNPRAPGLAELDAWLGKLDGPADPAAGERIFFHPKGPGCYRCHQIDGRGGRAGPELSTTAATLTRPRLVESILAPSKEIAPQFVPWLIAKTNGTVAIGALIEETDAGIQLYADSKGETFRIKTADIVERKAQTTSIMPENLAHTMTLGEFRDVIAYLRAPRGGEESTSQVKARRE